MGWARKAWALPQAHYYITPLVPYIKSYTATILLRILQDVLSGALCDLQRPIQVLAYLNTGFGKPVHKQPTKLGTVCHFLETGGEARG